MLITGSVMFSRFTTVLACNRQTDVHTVCLLQASTVLKRLNITEPVISIQSSLSLYYAVFKENKGISETRFLFPDNYYC